MSPAEFLKQYIQPFAPPAQPATNGQRINDNGQRVEVEPLLALLAEDDYAARPPEDTGWLGQIALHPERAWSEPVASLMAFYQAEIQRRDEIILNKDRDWGREVERVAQDYQAEIARIGRERERILAEQDTAWRRQVDRVVRDYQAEIVRIGRERDKRLADQELAFTLRERAFWRRPRYRELPPLEVEPLASVIIVNFNGLHFLQTVLPSLMRQTYRSFEILLVDNASTDASIAFVEQHYPAVRIIPSTKNLGFAGGNNLGIRAARGSVLALINNDTVVEPDWLFHLIDELRFDSRIAAVGSKITFFKPYISLTLRAPTFCPAVQEGSPDTRRLSLLVDEASAVAGCSYQKTLFGPGFYGSEQVAGRAARWAGDSAELLLPYEAAQQDLTVRLIAAGGRWSAGRQFTVELDGQILGQGVLEEGFTDYEFTVLAARLGGRTCYVINNAGSTLDASGNAGDRGIFQPDRGQYDSAEDMTALCGCSLLLRRAALEQVGYLDSDFFMYFEDTDLCWRLRRRGYRLRYQPASVVRHIHAGSSREWSPLFIFHTARNRVLMAVKNAPWPAVALSYGREWYYFLALLAALLRSARRGRPDRRLLAEARLRASIHASLFKQIPKALLKRWGLLPSH